MVKGGFCVHTFDGEPVTKGGASDTTTSRLKNDGMHRNLRTGRGKGTIVRIDVWIQIIVLNLGCVLPATAQPVGVSRAPVELVSVDASQSATGGKLAITYEGDSSLAKYARSELR